MFGKTGTMSKKEKKEEPPPAWKVEEGDKEAAKDYWKIQRSSAKREVTRRVNQVKPLLTSGPIKSEVSSRLMRYAESLKEQRERALKATDELTSLCEEPEEIEELQNFLLKLDEEIEATIDAVDEATAGGSKEVENQESDEESLVSMSSITGRDRNYFLLMSMNYDITKDVPKFDGTRIEDFETWLSQWDAAEAKLKSMEKSEAEKLLALKRCLKGRALEYIKNVKDGKEANFEGAKKMLVEYYLDKHTTGKLMVDKLLELPVMTKEAESIESVFFDLRSIWESLRGLNLNGEQGQTLLFCAIAETKMSPYVKKVWAKKLEEKMDPKHPIGHRATEEDLFSVLNREIKLQRSVAKFKRSDSKREDNMKKEEKKKEEKRENRGTLHGSFSVKKKEERNCLVCKKTGHQVANCFKLKELKGAQERRTFLKEHNIKLCWNCLRGRHSSKDCRIEPQCSVAKCGQKHHTLLHQNSRSVSTNLEKSTGSKNDGPSEETSSDNASASTVAAATARPVGPTPLLQVCKAWAVSPSSEKFLATVFLDSGSELTMIRRDLAKKMGLNGPSHSLSLTRIGGVELPTTHEKVVTFKLQSLKGDYMSALITAVTKDSLTDKIRGVEVNPEKFDHLKGLKFTEPLPRQPAVVDILIGVHDYAQFLTGSVIRGNPEEPVALETKLGLVLSGSSA